MLGSVRIETERLVIRPPERSSGSNGVFTTTSCGPQQTMGSERQLCESQCERELDLDDGPGEGRDRRRS